MSFVNEENYNLKRYSTCSESADLTGNDFTRCTEQESFRERRSNKYDFPENNGKGNSSFHSQQPIPDPPVLMQSRSSCGPTTHSVLQSSFSRGALSDDRLRTPTRNRYPFQSVEELSSPVQCSISETNIGLGKPNEESVNSFIEIQSYQQELSRVSSQPQFNSSTEIVFAARALKELKKKWAQEDDRDLSSSSSSRVNNGAPQIASSGDVMFPLPPSVRKEKSRKVVGGATTPTDRHEENLVNQPLKAEIKAKTLGNPYSLMDEEMDEQTRNKIIENQLAGFYRKAVDGLSTPNRKTSFSAISNQESRKNSTSFNVVPPRQDLKVGKDKPLKKVLFCKEAEISSPVMSNLVVPQPPPRDAMSAQPFSRKHSTPNQQTSDFHKKKTPVLPVMGGLAQWYPPTSRGESVRNNNEEKAERKDSVTSDTSTTVVCQTPLRSEDLVTFHSGVFQSSVTSDAGHRAPDLNSEVFRRPRKSKEGLFDNSSSVYLSNPWRMPLVGRPNANNGNPNSSITESSEFRGRDLATSQVPLGGQSLSSSKRLPSEMFPQLPKYLSVPISARIIGLPARINSTNRVPQTSREKLRVASGGANTSLGVGVSVGYEDGILRTTSQTDFHSTEERGIDQRIA